MRRLLLITLIVFIVLAVLLFSVGTWLINDEDFLKAQLGKQAYKFTGRELAVAGPLDIRLGRETTLLASDITFANPDWADTPDMIRIGHLQVRFNVPSLFSERKPAIPMVVIDGCSIDLVQAESGEQNWDILPSSPEGASPEPGSTQGLPVELSDVAITNCQLRLDTPDRTRPLQVAADEITLNRDANRRVSGRVAGLIDEEKISLHGWLEPAGAFLDGGPLEHDLQMEYGQVSLRSAGTFTDASTLTGADIEGRFHGPAMEDLLERFALPPFSEGDFDFRWSMGNSGGMTQLNIDGDLGSVDLKAHGELDQLLKPSAGSLVASLQGPDLESLGMTLGIVGLAPAPYAMKTRADFSGTRVRIADTELQADGSRLALTGDINIQDGLPGSALDVRLESDEIGRWAALAGLEQTEIGNLAVEGSINVDGNGVIGIDTVTRLEQSRLEAQGTIGPLAGPYEPDLVFDFDSPDASPLLDLAGIENFPAGPLQFGGHIQMADQRLKIPEFALVLQNNRAELTGALNLSGGYPESELDVSLDVVNVGKLARQFGLPDSVMGESSESDETGPWAPLIRLTQLESGKVGLEGSINIDGNGVVGIDAKTRFEQSHLETKGTIGPLNGPYKPDLVFDFSSPDASPVLALAGVENFPAEPLKFGGHVQKAQNRLNISEFALEFQNNRAELSGALNLSEGFSGSELTLFLDVADMDKLGQLFDMPGLPPQPLTLSGKLELEGKGLAFWVDQSELGDIRLSMNGRVADLENPLGVDAEFDVSLPGLDLLSAILPDLPWPPGEFKAAGRLQNGVQSTRLEDVHMKLGNVRATITGNLLHDNSFDLEISVQGPDATIFSELLGQPLEAKPFSLDTGLSGSPAALSLENLLLTLGKSRVGGDVEIGLGEPVRISGSLDSPYLDLRNFKTEPKADETPADKPPSIYVFDDSPVLTIDDYGVEVDASIRIDVLDLPNTQMRDIDVGVLLQKNFLQLDPLNIVGNGGGSLSGSIRIDGRQATPRLRYDLHARDLRLGLGSRANQDASTWPAGNFDLKIYGTGDTRRELAASLDGKVRVEYGAGQVGIAGLKFLMSDFITELLSILNPFAKTNEFTQLECAVIAADIVDGRVEVAPVIFNTNQVTILAQGNIDLGSEIIDLSFNSKARKGLGLSASNLVNPFIKVGGRLNSPGVEFDPSSAVVKGGLAAATMGLSILAKSMSDRFLSSEDPCGDALKEIAERDRANP